MDRVLRYDTSVETSRKERHFVGSDELFFRSHRCGNSRINERVCEKPKYLSLLLPHSKGTREGTFYFLIIERTIEQRSDCLLYTSPSPRDVEESRMPSSA